MQYRISERQSHSRIAHQHSISSSPILVIIATQDASGIGVLGTVALFLFTTGGFVIVVAIYSCILIVTLFSSPNYTWGLSYELCWMHAESTGCVVCASASSPKPFFKRCLPGISSSHGVSHGGPSQGATGGSHPIKTRRQLGRKQADAIGLQSGDDSESGRTVGDDDETTLWPKPQPSFDHDAAHAVLVSAPRNSITVGGSGRSNSKHKKTNRIEIV
ncbi:hypothetical protein F66182_8767 [Fusarium sp. NRRL 66182]|nr:hypothetical protein F66182_8767 [Fusarium sp. NRRL 66182]